MSTKTTIRTCEDYGHYETGDCVVVSLKPEHASMGECNGRIKATVTAFSKLAVGQKDVSQKAYDPCKEKFVYTTICVTQYKYQYCLEYCETETSPEGTVIGECHITSIDPVDGALEYFLDKEKGEAMGKCCHGGHGGHTPHEPEPHTHEIDCADLKKCVVPNEAGTAVVAGVDINVTDLDTDNILTDDGGGSKLTCADIVAANCYTPGNGIMISADGVVSTNIGPSTMVNNGDGTFTHTSGTGSVVIIDVCAAQQQAGCLSSLVANPDGSYTHDNGAGLVVTIPASNPSSFNNPGNGTLVHDNGAGALTIIDPCLLQKQAGCFSKITLNPDGTFTHDDGYGLTVQLPGVSKVQDNGDGTVTHTDGLGIPTILDFCAIQKAGGCLSGITANPDGTFTHDNGDGVTVVLPGVSKFVDNGDGTVTHTDGLGAPVTIDICALQLAGGCVSSLAPNPAGGFTFDDGYGNTVPLPAGATSVVTDNGDGTYDHDDGNGTVVPIDTCGVAADNTDCVLTLPDCAGGPDVQAKVLPLDINTLNEQLNGLYGSANDGSDCPTRCEVPCGASLIGGDDGLIEKICTFDFCVEGFSTTVNNAPLDTATAIPQIATPNFDRWQFAGSLDDIPDPTATTGIQLPSCLKWVAVVEGIFFYGMDLQNIENCGYVNLPGYVSVIHPDNPANGILGCGGGALQGGNSTRTVNDCQGGTVVNNNAFNNNLTLPDAVFNINQNGPTPVTYNSDVQVSNSIDPRPEFNRLLVGIRGLTFRIAKV